ncbi:MAG: 4-(cytidine 5'-diphospho)-2-C-methyl-D-erythritol kinase [Candidatus Bipolaricaulota bacterium]|nr:4-(cytidine 5'-diphospho)-2-C-methyl-D-erythritol kinase [Candidatus Bipolaricaulota bacterium]MDW8030583.1 4-(cytidine 5'-diphospho)-2-C-methyl-D-erythritol kinase [Candidatus Bipolaricaulota bacterium]
MIATKLVIKAFAKINLGLRVQGKRPDGYHEIETVFQSLDLSDTLTLELSELPGIHLEISSPWRLPHGQENLVYRGAALILARGKVTDRGVRILLEKRIPVGAGLGGGSSDAAATLGGLNELFGLKLSSAELHELALQLGSDVPYFLVGGLCRGRGRGELLEKLPERFAGYSFVLAMPHSTLSTAEVYRRYDELCSRGWQPSPPRLWKNIDWANDLEEAALELCPELRTLRELIKTLRPELWGMSGSGPTYYAAWASSAPVRSAAQLLTQKNYVIYLARPTPRGYELCCRL